MALSDDKVRTHRTGSANTSSRAPKGLDDKQWRDAAFRYLGLQA